ncbi:UNVERIFIED_CONTAM: hypothetical protein Sangu_0678100 [Sesamum angustifolium]|uniref:Uncharacterized protein n=1 Tax=Sesamum angustifolium TaxID=2727405 RepID=A0AAW2PT22_9LAMI
MAFGRNTKEELRQSTVANLTIQREKNMELYLGFPSRVSRSKWDIFANILERILGKIMGWNEKLLSQAGKEVLIKVFVQAVCSYAMGCLKLPAMLLKEIQEMIATFGKAIEIGVGSYSSPNTLGSSIAYRILGMVEGCSYVVRDSTKLGQELGVGTVARGVSRECLACFQDVCTEMGMEN